MTLVEQGKFLYIFNGEGPTDHNYEHQTDDKADVDFFAW